MSRRLTSDDERVSNIEIEIGNEEPRLRIWQAGELSETCLPPLHSVLFGVFQVVDCKLRAEGEGDVGHGGESYIDFAYGSDESRFSGVHRFSIVHSSDKRLDGSRSVQIHQQTMCCNPSVDKPLKPEFMMDFHMAYSQLLFKEGVAKITKWLER